MAGRPVVALLLALLLAGCADPGQPSPTESSPTGSMSITSPTPAAATAASAPVVVERGRTIELDDCAGWMATINYPGANSPGERPEGWSPAGQSPLTAVAMQAYRCNRVSVGPFERGPLHILVEGHSNADFPPGCEAHTPDAIPWFRVGTQLWIDDAEVGAYLRDQYGAPVTVGTFTGADQDLPAGGIHTWTWTADGGQPSELTVTHDGQDGPKPTAYERYFWANGTGLAQLDLSIDEVNPVTQSPGHGQMQPPTQFASDTDGAFAGLAEWSSQRSASGVFTVYSDRLCEQPIP